MNLDPAAFIFCNSSPYPLHPFALPDILDSFQMAMYKIFSWCILVPTRFHETITCKITRTIKIKSFWHNVLFVFSAHIHFAPCNVCACCCWDKWTAQTVNTYSHWSDDDDDDDDDAVTNEQHRRSSHIPTDQMMRCTNKTKTNIWTKHQSGFKLISHCHIFISCAATDLRFSFDKLKTNSRQTWCLGNLHYPPNQNFLVW